MKIIGATATKLMHRETGESSISSERALELIRARAYRLFELRGHQPGRELEDWLQAEREILLPSPPRAGGMNRGC